MLRPADRSELLTALAPFAQQLRNRRILLTGASGFFGRWILGALAALEEEAGLGLRIFAQSRDPARFLGEHAASRAQPTIHWIAVHPAELQAHDIPGGRLDAVIHLVTEANASALTNDTAGAHRTIVDSTRAALRVAETCRSRHFLFTSSGSVYQRSGHPSLESDPLVPVVARTRSVHAIGGALKRKAEELCFDMTSRSGVATVIARCFSFVGPGLPFDGKFAIGNFLADALHARDIILTGDGRAVRSYLYASDLVVWLLTLLLRGGPGSVYNVGSNEFLSLGDIAERVRANVAPAVRVRITGSPTSTVDYYVPDVRKAESELGLVQIVSLDEGLRRTAAWARARMRG